jgi:hypothetical protein
MSLGKRRKKFPDYRTKDVLECRSYSLSILFEMDRNATSIEAMRSARLRRLCGGHNSTHVPKPTVETCTESTPVSNATVESPRSPHAELTPYQIRPPATVRQVSMQSRRQPCKRKHMDGMRRAVGGISQLNAEFHRRLGGMSNSERTEHFMGGLQEKDAATQQKRKVGLHGFA